MKLQTLFLLCLLFSISSSILQRKQRAGPPSEFSELRIPEPVVQKQSSFEIPISFTTSRLYSNLGFSTPFAVDSEELFALSVYTPQKFKVTIRDPSYHPIDLSKITFEESVPIGDGGIYVPVTTYVVSEPKIGVWHLEIQTTENLTPEQITRITEDNIEDGKIVVWNSSPLVIASHLSNYFLKQNNQIGVVAMISQNDLNAMALNLSVAYAELEVTKPDGEHIHLTMHDDGLHADGVASDGIYGALFTADEEGEYISHTELLGITNQNIPFQRSTQRLFKVVPDLVNLDGSAHTAPSQILGDDERITIVIGVKPTSTDRDYRGYAEVLATNEDGKLVPACWISSVVNIVDNQFELELNLNWLSRANLKEPIMLQYVYVDDLETNFPVTFMDNIPVTSTISTSLILSKLRSRPNFDEITEEMRQGIWLDRPAYNLTAAPTLVTIHGYCSATNPWTNAGFTDAANFLNAKANLPHNEFSKKLHAFTESKGMTSCSSVGHSQGGCVGLHLHNHYWSCLDNSKGNRVVQSVGTPYKGCTGAGVAADLVKIFGVACGSNTDLTCDSSVNWLKGIDSVARSKVYYYTTTYKLGTLLGDYCNMAVNLILQWPNDGTSELDYAQCPGGNNMGNKEKWCHTADMAYPFQCTDATRNKEMNTYAAR